MRLSILIRLIGRALFVPSLFLVKKILASVRAYWVLSGQTVLKLFALALFLAELGTISIRAAKKIEI